MLPHQIGQTVVYLGPHLKRHDGLKRRAGQFQAQIPCTVCACVDDGAFLLARAQQEARHALQGPLGSRHADAPQGLLSKHLQAFQGERQVGAALASGECVQFIQNHRADVTEYSPPALGRQQQVQRFRGGYQDMRRLFEKPAAVGRRTVAGA